MQYWIVTPDYNINRKEVHVKQKFNCTADNIANNTKNR